MKTNNIKQRACISLDEAIEAANKHSRNILCASEICTEIDIWEFLKRLRKSKEVYMIQGQPTITTFMLFDNIYIEVSDPNSEYGVDGEVKVALGNTINNLICCQIALNEYTTKFYLQADNDDHSIIELRLFDTPFTEIEITLLYGKD
jgi:hypothetical protein